SSETSEPHRPRRAILPLRAATPAFLQDRPGLAARSPRGTPPRGRGGLDAAQQKHARAAIIPRLRVPRQRPSRKFPQGARGAPFSAARWRSERKRTQPPPAVPILLSVRVRQRGPRRGTVRAVPHRALVGLARMASLVRRPQG